MSITRAEAVDDLGNWHAQVPAPVTVVVHSAVPFSRSTRSASPAVPVPLRITEFVVLAAVVIVGADGTRNR